MRTTITPVRFTSRDAGLIVALRARAASEGYQVESDADALRWALAVACEAPKGAWAKGAALLARVPEEATEGAQKGPLRSQKIER